MAIPPQVSFGQCFTSVLEQIFMHVTDVISVLGLPGNRLSPPRSLSLHPSGSAVYIPPHSFILFFSFDFPDRVSV